MIIKALVKGHCVAMKVHCAAEQKCAQPVSGKIDTLGNLSVKSDVDLSIVNRTGPPVGPARVKWARGVAALRDRLRVQDCTHSGKGGLLRLVWCLLINVHCQHIHKLVCKCNQEIMMINGEANLIELNLEQVNKVY